MARTTIDLNAMCIDERLMTRDYITELNTEGNGMRDALTLKRAGMFFPTNNGTGYFGRDLGQPVNLLVAIQCAPHVLAWDVHEAQQNGLRQEKVGRRIGLISWCDGGEGWVATLRDEHGNFTTVHGLGYRDSMMERVADVYDSIYALGIEDISVPNFTQTA